MDNDVGELETGAIALPADAIERIAGALGQPLFEFVINDTLEALGSGTASSRAVATALALDKVLMREYAGESNPSAWAEVLKGHLTDTATSPQPLALRVRVDCGAVDAIPTSEDPIEHLLIDLAVHTYPSFLLPEDRDPTFPKWTSWAPVQVTSALLRDPLNKQFEDALAKDPAISKVFAHSVEGGGLYANVMTSSGRGGSVQLTLFAGQILSAAWRGSQPSLVEFVDRSLTRLRLVRDALAKKPARVNASLAFTGVLLPGAGPYDFGEVTLRKSTPVDHEYAPESLSGQLSGTDASGVTTAINYAGDVIAELKIPYEARFSKKGLNDTPEPWPEDLLKLNPVNDVATRLRASLLLATEREHRVQITLSWQNTDDPLNGPVFGWSEPREFVGLMPTALTEDEITRWQEWYQLLSAPGADRIHLAVSRVVRATGERRDAVDVLIDSVIAWENLFGTKDGEPTLRVTASISLLLESEPPKRRALRSELVKIYRLRSDAVHGTAMPQSSEIQLCFRALDVAILAIRTLVKDRPDVLAEPDGGARSLRLILGEESTGEIRTAVRRPSLE